MNSIATIQHNHDQYLSGTTPSHKEPSESTKKQLPKPLEHTMSPPQLLPAGFTNRGYWLSSFSKPGEVIDLPTPQAGPGSAVVQVAATLILPYVAKVHRGEIPQLNLALPMVPNANCVGRVLEVGPDAARVRPGDWVWVDGTVHARDDALVKIVQGHHGGEGTAGRVLMQGEWRDGSMQRVMKAPLESCHVIDQEYLFGKEGHAPEELTPIILYNSKHHSASLAVPSLSCLGKFQNAAL